jgi:ATP-binding cassette subfamily C (CFTR/MRP) protein 1
MPSSSDEPVSFGAIAPALAGEDPTAIGTPRFASSLEFAAGLPSRILFLHALPLIRVATTAPLTALDLPPLHESDRAAVVFAQWEQAWAADAAAHGGKPSVNRTLWKLHGSTYFKALAQTSVGVGMMFAPPFCLKHIISSLQPGGDDAVGYVWCVGLFCCGTVQAIMTQQGVHSCFRLAMHVKTQLVLAVYRKTFSASQRTRVLHSTGETVNLMSVDAQRFPDSFPIFLWGFLAPVILAVALTWLSDVIGGVALGSSVAIIVPFVVTMIMVGKASGGMAKKMQRFKDQRVKLSSDAIAGIRIVKYYGWEQAVIERIRSARAQEMTVTRAIAVCKGVTSSLGSCIPMLLSASMFVLFSYHTGRDIEAKQAAMTIVLVNTIKMPMHLLPLSIIVLVMTLVSLRRIQDYLTGSEAQADGFDVVDDLDGGTPQLQIVKGVFSWGTEAEPNAAASASAGDGADAGPSISTSANADARTEFRLRLSLSVGGPRLIGVIGAVGNGKSSIFSAILGEMTLRGGSVKRRGRVAMCEQVSWICNATVRDNILFGRPFDKQWYGKVLHAAALEDDLAILVSGDATEIGERGINLSGGQKARVALARAMYSDADVYMLDDVLSAVDVHVGAHIFQHGVLGLLKNKLVVFATNQLHLLADFDEVLLLKDGEVCAQGRADELEGSSDAFRELMQEYNRQLATKETEVDAAPASTADSAAVEAAPEVVETDRLKRTDGGEDSPAPGSKHAGAQSAAQLEKGKIVSVETKETGAVSSSVWRRYYDALGHTSFWLTTGSLALGLSSMVVADIWVGTVWASKSGGLTQQQYMRVFLCIIFGSMCLMAFSLWRTNTMSVAAAARIFDQMLRNVFYLPLGFFESVPSGRIINRFSSDTDKIDQLLPQNLEAVLKQYGFGLVILLFIISSLPPIIVILVPLAWVYYKVSQLYRPCARDNQRLEALSRSPIFNRFQVRGAAHVRCPRFTTSATGHWLAALLTH